MITSTTVRIALLSLAVAMLQAMGAPSDREANLAREKGARAIGSGSNGPFVISKLNDGRVDSMGMWSSDGKDGAFCGVRLGDEPVAFNTVRFHLFNGRAAFSGWRLEGADDVEIDDDPDPGVCPGTAAVYDPELIAADAEGQFLNSSAKEPNVVTVSFKGAKYKSVRLIFLKLPGGPKASVGVPELEVFNRGGDAAPRARLGGAAGLALDNVNNTITLPRPVTVAELLGKLAQPAGVTVLAHDPAGQPLRDADPVGNGCTLVAKFQTGGGDQPFETEYQCYSIVDARAPLPALKPPKAVRPSKPPKPPVSVASAPDAPGGTVNLILGKTITGSIRPESGAKFAASGAGDWFLTQQIPQWISVDFGAQTEFNYFAIASAQVVHFRLQTSGDGLAWKDLAEVDRVRPPYRWNGYFEKTTARYLRLVVLKPSWDVHVKKILVADLAQPPADPDGRPAQALKAAAGTLPELPGLPAAAPLRPGS